MTTTSTPPATTGRPYDADSAPNPPALWRWAGGLALAHLIVMLGAFALEGVAAEHGASASSVARTYADASLSRMLGAGYVEAFAFVVLVPALVLLARLFGRRTDAARTAAQTFLGLGIAYVAATLAVGFPPGAAAAYAAHHGVDADVVSAINDVRNYGFMLQVMLLAAMTAALGTAALLGRVMVRWVGWGGVVIGVAGVCLVPFAHNAVSLVWMIWWAGLAVLCLRGGPSPRNR
jgi:hypothetical protein